jgi:hypothetical protein
VCEERELAECGGARVWVWGWRWRRAAAREGGRAEAEKGRGRLGKDAFWGLKQGVSSSGDSCPVGVG